MARHMRNGRDYSRPGPKVDYELRKDSNNAARSGEVYDKIEEIQSHLKDNGKSFIFGYHNGKFGYYTEESKGADSFVPFRSVGEFDTFVKRIVGSATNQYQTYKFDVEEGTNYFFTLYTLNAAGGGRIRKITGGSYEILAGRYVSDTEVTSVYTPACIIHAESTTITIEAVMGMSEIYLTPYACLYKLTQ